MAWGWQRASSLSLLLRCHKVSSSTLTPTPYHDVLPHSRLPKLPQKPRAKINIYPLELFASSILLQ